MVARMHHRLLTLAALAAAAPAAFAAPPGWVSGIASYYTVPGSTCNLPAPASGLHTAIGDAHFAGGAACGAHIEIRAPGRPPVTVQVTNRCPECGPGHLDLWPDAFAQLAPLAKGVVRPLRLRYVPAPVSGPAQIVIKDGSSRWWTAVQVREHRYPVSTLEVRRGSGWRSVPRAPWGYFVAERGLGPGPYVFRVTDNRGQRIVTGQIPLRPGQVTSAGAQFAP